MPNESKIGICIGTQAGEILFRDSVFTELAGAGDLLEATLRSTEGRQPDGSQTLVVEQNGRSLLVRIVDLDAAGSPPMRVCVIHDATESKRTKERLQVSLELMSSLVDASPIAIVTLDLDQKVTLWNPKAENVFGWTKEQVLGEAYPLVPEAEREGFEKLFQRVVVDGEGFTGVEVKRECKDGSYALLSISTAPLRDSHGKITGALALLADLTQQRTLEEQVRHAQKMEAVGRLAGGVAHDFNNLLTVMLANTQLLRRHLDDREQVIKSTSAIEHCAERARDLIQQLLTFSRREVVNPTLLDVNDLVRNTVQMLRRTLSEAYQISTDLTPCPPVRADAGQIEQVLLNLVVNARDAMENGGLITVRTSTVMHTPQTFKAKPGEFVCLSVSDTGTGIDEDVLPHIFEPFFSTKRAGEGTGLGLSTVYGIATRSGGTIEVDNEPGKGVTFRVLIPRAQAAFVQRPSAEVDESVIPQSEGHILVVEDEALVLEAVTAMVKALGYDATPVQGGREALVVIAAGTAIDLVLTDVYMPEMTGRGLADQLGASQPTLPIVFMSGNLTDQELRARVEAGEAAFLLKPVSINDLARTLRDAIAAK